LKTDPSLAQPIYLSEHGNLAYRAILMLLRKRKATYTGGCKAFFSPEEWIDKGEEFGRNAELIVCHDGGELAPFFNSSYGHHKSIEEMQKAVRSVGCYIEPIASWCSAIYAQNRTGKSGKA
jgi:hypothetical protein